MASLNIDSYILETWLVKLTVFEIANKLMDFRSLKLILCMENQPVS